MRGFVEGLRAKLSYIWRSIFRYGWPETPKGRILVIAGNVFLHLHPARTAKSAIRVTHTFCLGGLSFFFFIVLTVTGILLMFYYVPSVERAYTDMQDLESKVQLGMFLRNMHRWAAHAMVITVWLHMIRVFFTRSYKPPREFNWVVGVMLLVLTLLLSFTGYLLPWDQLSFWAVTVGTNLVGYAPVVGPYLRPLLLGEYEVGQSALIRFYTLHVIALPLLTAILCAVHFWRVRKDGISRPL